MRNLELPGRSPVRSTGAMAATSHPLSTLTAIEVLRAGGNAIDAAIAACAVQGVVEPQSTGIGGDCFALMSLGGSDEIIAFNGSGRAPAAAAGGWFREQGIHKIERLSPHAVTIPGAVDAWEKLLAAHGRKSLGELLQPAIRYAREGYVVLDRVAFDWSHEVEALRYDDGAAAVFLPNGRLPRPGDVHRQPALAATLELIAEQGRDGFYKGRVAEDMVAHLQGRGGLHTMEDFAAAEGDYVQPIRGSYRGHEVYECPPNGQGIVALEMLNILSGYDLASLDALSSERLHLEIEAGRLAYNNRDAWLADPAKAPVPVERWLSSAHADSLRAQIDPHRALGALPPTGMAAYGDTVYLCVVDEDRNAVSLINSIFSSFGSCLMAPETGVLFHNRGAAFVVEEGHPNEIAPDKRPLHTIIPGMLCRDGKAVMPFGVMGGQYQAVGHAHLLTNLLDYGMDPQEAIDCPRLFPIPGGPVEIESGIPEEAARGLREMGHDLAPAEKPIGGAQAIHIDWETGVLTGASEPRKDGCALGY